MDAIHLIINHYSVNIHGPRRTRAESNNCISIISLVKYVFECISFMSAVYFGEFLSTVKTKVYL